jgi:hypothetical protein
LNFCKLENFGRTTMSIPSAPCTMTTLDRGSHEVGLSARPISHFSQSLLPYGRPQIWGEEEHPNEDFGLRSCTSTVSDGMLIGAESSPMRRDVATDEGQLQLARMSLEAREGPQNPSPYLHLWGRPSKSVPFPGLPVSQPASR